MKAVLFQKPWEAACIDVPKPQPGPGQALIRIVSAGICGSDIGAYRGTNALVSYPRIIGHELAGIVEQIPEDNAAGMTVEMLRAYGIPVMKKYDEKDGTLGKVLFGTPSGGVGLYVPESMLEDAKNLLAPVEESTRNEEES